MGDLPPEPPGELTSEDRDHFMELSHSLFAVVDGEGRLLRLSPSWETLLGWSRDEVVGRHYSELMHPDDVEHTVALMRAAALGGYDLPPVDNRYLRADGRAVWLRWQTKVGPDRSQVWCIARDITASRLRAEQQQVVADLGRTALEGVLLAELLQAAVEGVARGLDVPFAVLAQLVPGEEFMRVAAAVSPPPLAGQPEARRYVAADDTTLAGRAVRTGLAQVLEDTQADESLYSQRMQQVGVRSGVAVAVGPPGAAWGSLSAGDVRPRAWHATEVRFVEQVAHVIASALERREIEQRLQHQATHDSLTGLPNRELLRERVDEALREARRSGAAVGLLLCDLDGFKDINDSLGHAAGDAVLQQLAARLLSTVGEGGTVARLGGDEFALCVVGPATELEVLGVANAVVQVMRQPFSLPGLEVPLSTSIGVAVSPAHGRDASTMLRHADVAMYRAKTRRLGWAVYDPGIDAARGDRLAMTTELRAALADGQLELHYQPVVDLASGRMTSVEALCRWTHPDRGSVPPAVFVPLAEQTGLIQPLTAWVVEEAARQVRAWEDDGHRLPCAVNLSMAAVGDAPTSRALIARLAAAAPLLTVEITESWLADSRGKDTVAQLAAAGVGLALDDFGTGWSSLASLRAFPVQRLKLDRLFVAELEVDARGSDLLAAVCSLAGALGMDVVAEGVEHVATVRRLRASGISLGQGFLWSPALPADELARWAGWDQVPAKHRA